MSIIHWPFEAWMNNVALAALSSRETVWASYSTALAAILADVPGDFVECGVFGGAQAAAMARAIMNTGSERRVHLFDSFAGIPAAGPNDAEFLAAGHEAGLSSCTLAAVQEHMREWGITDDMLVYHPGLFADTVPGADIGRIAVLRLDGDLYESTKACVDALVPKVSKGGWVIVDDYHLTGCRQAVTEALGYPAPMYFQR